jgi:hypothetical protein
VANPVGLMPGDWFEKYLTTPFAFGLLSTTVLCLVSMVVRYRGAHAVEREQIKWLVYACAWFALTYIMAVFSNMSQASWGAGAAWVLLLNALGVMTMPAAIGIAILRYRLWDIDVLIRKTLVYAVLTALLALVYFGCVVLLQRLLSSLTGVTQSPLALVVSTLAIAALFTPLLRRIQKVVDRRFYRQKYDALRVLAQFAVTARDETNLDALTGELVRVVQETVQPEKVSVWLKRN